MGLCRLSDYCHYTPDNSNTAGRRRSEVHSGQQQRREYPKIHQTDPRSFSGISQSPRARREWAMQLSGSPVYVEIVIAEILEEKRQHASPAFLSQESDSRPKLDLSLSLQSGWTVWDFKSSGRRHFCHRTISPKSRALRWTHSHLLSTAGSRHPYKMVVKTHNDFSSG